MSFRLSADGWERLKSYRVKANEADAKAARANDPHVRIIWTQIARSWRLLADHLARELKLHE
jgi:hypothetical protein